MGRRQLFRRLRNPLHVQVEITQKCNQACGHCYNVWKQKSHDVNSGNPSLSIAMMNENAKSMDMDVAQKVLDELVCSKVFSVTLTGGEPFLNFKVLKFLIEEFKKAKIQVSINTNLTLLNSKIISLLKNENVSGLLVSILGASSKTHDGITNLEGSFERLVNNISLCVLENIGVSANMVVTEDNVSEVKDVARLVKKLGCDSFYCSPAVPNSCELDSNSLYHNPSKILDVFSELLWAQKILKISTGDLIRVPLCFLASSDLVLDLRSSACGAGTSFCVIGTNGEVRACAHGADVYGSIIDGHLHDAWMKMEEWRTDELVPEKCRDCGVLLHCGGGCRHLARQMNSGCKDSKDPLMIEENREKSCEMFVDRFNNHKSKALDISLGEKIIFYPFGIREEDFGGVLWRGYRKILLNEKACFLLSRVVPSKEYVTKEILSYCGNDEEFLKSLVLTGFAFFV